jgi:hypothetical protein
MRELRLSLLIGWLGCRLTYARVRKEKLYGK